MELSTRYSPEETEARLYQHWMDRKYFRSTPDEREAYSIVIPPPNVTGVLHMGHMLNNTIQDILTRKARLDGKNACWVPGTDHASIATEAKVVKMLREKGIKKGDIGREEFLKHAFAWKEEYGGIILEQLKRLGASCDWDRTRFTMEPKLSDAVMKVFVDLYRKGRVYRQLRMTNWDPEAQTVLSNEEVLHGEENAQLFHLRYDAADGLGQSIVIATQRPETIMADVAIAVHPQDDRFKVLIGKEVKIPLIDRAIPVIADEYVDREFGTGALKITPAHDQNDYAIGQRHGLEVIDIFNADGTLNEKAEILIGEDRFEARKKIKKLLEASGHLIKLEDYVTKIGRSERTHAVVEPRLTLQWFVDMKELSRTALHAVESEQVKFWPGQFWNMYYNWLREENVRDWCISRQLWWGHRVPAWYYGEHVFVAETAVGALQEARIKTGNPNLSMDDLQQDEDVLDTWFSSWLWPISVFDGFENQEELKYYYPTSVLVTGWDIIYLWVARMIMSGYEWSGELLGLDHVLKHGRHPFKDVYFTGMVRDNKRRKMSKQLGNSPEALKLLDIYGADGVRFGMMSSAAAGNDIIFDAPFDPETREILNESKLCEQGRNFCNKMWNALRLIQGWEISEAAQSSTTQSVNALAGRWLENKLEALVEKLDGLFAEYRLSEALMDLYKFIWDDFCSWYLEMIKPEYGQPIDRTSYQKVIDLFEKQMTLLHPFMPFVTEEIWQHLRKRDAGDDCVISRWPAVGKYDGQLIAQIEQAKSAVSSIRDIRNSKGIKMRDPLAVFIQESLNTQILLAASGWREMVIKMANLSALTASTIEVDNSISFLAGTETFFVVLEQEIDTAAECARLKEELSYYEGFLKQVNAKLSNEKFVSGAPAAVVDKERQKQADGEAKLKSIVESLGQLGCG